MSANPGRLLFRFVVRSGKTREFGPYADADEAAEAFQRVYGYWPAEPILVRPYVPEEASA